MTIDQVLRNELTPEQYAAAVEVLPAYPDADFNALVRVLTDWGRRINR